MTLSMALQPDAAKPEIQPSGAAAVSLEGFQQHRPQFSLTISISTTPQ
jgi:hypothetical protein